MCLIAFTSRGARGRIETLDRRTVPRHGVRNPQGDSEVLAPLNVNKTPYAAEYGGFSGGLYSPGDDRKTIIRAGAGLFYDRSAN
jgi:hypothetical protein